MPPSPPARAAYANQTSPASIRPSSDPIRLVRHPGQASIDPPPSQMTRGFQTRSLQAALFPSPTRRPIQLRLTPSVQRASRSQLPPSIPPSHSPAQYHQTPQLPINQTIPISASTLQLLYPPRCCPNRPTLPCPARLIRAQILCQRRAHFRSNLSHGQSHDRRNAWARRHMMQSTPPPLDPAMVADDRTLADLLGWLDGPKANERLLDWIFRDSPEAPQLLDWSQMQDWANFDMPCVASDQIASASTLAGQSQQPQPQSQQPQHHQQPSLQHQRHASISEPVQHQSPLLVLSSAAEMIEYPPRTPRVRSQHLAQPSNGASAASPARIGVNSPRHSIDIQHAGASTDSKIIAGRRSRWNSPDPAPMTNSTPAIRPSRIHTTQSETQAMQTSIPIATIITAWSSLPTPHAGRRSAAIKAWPNRWNPAVVVVNSLPAFSFTKASEEQLMSEDMAHVKRVESLGPAAYGRAPQQCCKQRPSNDSASTLRSPRSTPPRSTSICSSFSTIATRTSPAIRQPTFHPDRCDPRLLAALCCIGALFSEVPGSRNAAVYLASLTQMSVSRATLANHAFARVTSTFQSIWSGAASASPRVRSMPRRSQAPTAP